MSNAKHKEQKVFDHRPLEGGVYEDNGDGTYTQLVHYRDNAQKQAIPVETAEDAAEASEEQPTHGTKRKRR